eukprot:2367454-Rhodomonas_salina.2
MTWGFQIPSTSSQHEMILCLTLAKAPPRPAMIQTKVGECLDLDMCTNLSMDLYLFDSFYNVTLEEGGPDLGQECCLLRVEAAGITAPNISNLSLVFKCREGGVLLGPTKRPKNLSFLAMACSSARRSRKLTFTLRSCRSP